MRRGARGVRACLAAVAVAAAAAAGGGPSRAALPPWQERAREIAAILDSPEVRERLGGAAARPVEAVERLGEDRWRVRSADCAVEVRVVDAPGRGGAAARPGPRAFDLRVGRAECRPR